MKSLLVLIASLTFALAPLLTPDFGGFDPDRYPVPQVNSPVQPAGWAFAIWGIIYLLLIAHAAIGFARHKRDEHWEPGRLPLLVSLLIGTGWLSVAAISPLWATLLIIVMLASALLALYRMRAARPTWIALWPVALYAGWLSAATFVSLGLLLAGYGVLSGTMAAVVALICATLFAVVNQLKLAQWPYATAVAWGFIGIAIANLGQRGLIAALAALAAAALLSLALVQRRRSANADG